MEMKDRFGKTIYTLVGGQRLQNVHPKDACAGQHCTIHNPSMHHMRQWNQNWRDDAGFMERICPEHGVGHPDPDEINKPEQHGCCGCCSDG